MVQQRSRIMDIIVALFVGIVVGIGANTLITCEPPQDLDDRSDLNKRIRK